VSVCAVVCCVIFIAPIYVRRLVLVETPGT
jgi:hypothetical protein